MPAGAAAAQLLVDGAGALEVGGDSLARRAADGERVAAEISANTSAWRRAEAAGRPVLDELDRGRAERLARRLPPSG